jgi:hypothetical protein
VPDRSSAASTRVRICTARGRPPACRPRTPRTAPLVRARKGGSRRPRRASRR